MNYEDEPLYLREARAIVEQAEGKYDNDHQTSTTAIEGERTKPLKKTKRRTKKLAKIALAIGIAGLAVATDYYANEIFLSAGNQSFDNSRQIELVRKTPDKLVKKIITPVRND